jgi:RNA polymerase sigma-70 factor (sigma-E family)
MTEPPGAVWTVTGQDVAVPPAGFDGWVAQSWIGLHRFAYLVTRDRYAAEDLVQDALCKVYPRWDKLVAKGDPDAYIRRAIVNAHISEWRRHGRVTLTDDTGPYTDGGGDIANGVTDAGLAAQLLAELPARQRAAVVLRYYEDRDYREIAAVVGGSEAAARSLVRHALAALRDRLPQED